MEVLIFLAGVVTGIIATALALFGALAWVSSKAEVDPYDE